MDYKDFLTTGEATVLLGISRSTVSRKFDQGVLKGKRNPITGDRLISYDSLMEFVRKYDLPLICETEKKQKILVVALDNKLTSLIHEAIGRNINFDLTYHSHGADALIMCAKEPVDLFIIDNELPDISGWNILGALQRMKMVNEMKILCCYESGESRHSWESQNEVHVRKDLLTAHIMKEKINHLLNIRDDYDDISYAFKHNRLWPRIPLNIPTLIINSMMSQQGKEGVAVIKDISYGGAFLSQIQLPLDIPFPESFIFLMKTDHYPLKNWEAESQLIRVKPAKSLDAGVRFTDISNDNREKILKLLS